MAAFDAKAAGTCQAVSCNPRDLRMLVYILQYAIPHAGNHFQYVICQPRLIQFKASSSPGTRQGTIGKEKKIPTNQG